MFNGQKIMLAGEFWSLPQKLLLLSNVMNSSRFLLKGFNCNPPKILARCNFVCLDPAWIFIGQRFSSALTHAGSSCACSLGLLFIGPSIGCKILPPDNYNFSTFSLRRSIRSCRLAIVLSQFIVKAQFALQWLWKVTFWRYENLVTEKNNFQESNLANCIDCMWQQQFWYTHFVTFNRSYSSKHAYFTTNWEREM